MTKTIKIILIVGGIALILFLGFYFMPSSNSTESGLSKSVSTSVATTDSSNATAFLSTLLSLNRIKVDTSIFTSPIFTKLQDNTVPILNDGVVGRPNPFSEIDNTSPVDNGINFPQINNVSESKNSTNTN